MILKCVHFRTRKSSKQKIRNASPSFNSPLWEMLKSYCLREKNKICLQTSEKFLGDLKDNDNPTLPPNPIIPRLSPLVNTTGSELVSTSRTWKHVRLLKLVHKEEINCWWPKAINHKCCSRCFNVLQTTPKNYVCVLSTPVAAPTSLGGRNNRSPATGTLQSLPLSSLSRPHSFS